MLYLNKSKGRKGEVAGKRTIQKRKLKGKVPNNQSYQHRKERGKACYEKGSRKV